MTIKGTYSWVSVNKIATFEMFGECFNQMNNCLEGLGECHLDGHSKMWNLVLKSLKSLYLVDAVEMDTVKIYLLLIYLFWLIVGCARFRMTPVDGPSTNMLLNFVQDCVHVTIVFFWSVSIIHGPDFTLEWKSSLKTCPGLAQHSVKPEYTNVGWFNPIELHKYK